MDLSPDQEKIKTIQLLGHWDDFLYNEYYPRPPTCAPKGHNANRWHALYTTEIDDKGDGMNLLVLIVIGIVIALVAISLIILGRRNTQHDDDPLMARLAEATQRGKNVTLEEIELSQPFAGELSSLY